MKQNNVGNFGQGYQLFDKNINVCPQTVEVYETEA